MTPYVVPADDLPAIRPSVTVADAAKAISADPSTVRKMLRRGELEGHGVGKRGVRVFADSVAAYQRRKALVPTAAPEKAPQNQSASHRAAVAALRAAGIL